MTLLLAITHTIAVGGGMLISLLFKSKSNPKGVETVNAFERFFAKMGKIIAWPFVHGEQVIATLSEALKDEPQVKTAIVGLVAQIKTITEDTAVAIAAKGLDIPDDVQTAEDAKALWTYVTVTFIPQLEAAYKDVAGQAAAPAAPAAPASSPVADPGPAAVVTTAGTPA